MSVLIKGMEMPTTGIYFVSVDNTSGRDKTVITVERMLGNRDVRQIVGSFGLAPVTPHGDLIDRNELIENCMKEDSFLAELLFRKVSNASTIIPAEEGFGMRDKVEYVERDKVMDALLHEQYGYLCEDAIRSIPAADVRPVVLCQDCRHRDPEDHKCDCGQLERAGCMFPVDDDYFCAHGEKMEES